MKHLGMIASSGCTFERGIESEDEVVAVDLRSMPRLQHVVAVA